MHVPVLLDKVCEFFYDVNGVLVDATLGLGGHSYALLSQNKNLHIIGIDKDKEALALAHARLECFGERFHAVHGNFSQKIVEILRDYEVRGILADIGVSSYQIDNKSRGFSFECENLDMRMDKSSPLSAEDIINSYSRDELHAIFKNYGEIPQFERITKAIIDYRKKTPITSGRQLSEFIAPIIHTKKNIHPATLVFQALRIAVNDELGELSRFLDNIAHVKNAKVAMISFHSLEDRIIKDRFKEFAKNCICDDNVMKCVCGGNNARGKIYNKKPIVPSQREVQTNKRARSAKMRCFVFF